MTTTYKQLRTASTLTASRALVSSASGNTLEPSAVTATELGYISGVTSAVQTQLGAKLPLAGGTMTGAITGTSGTVAFRDSTTAQKVEVYGTASGSPGSDYVRAALSCSTTVVTLAAESGGTGADDIDIVLSPAGTGSVGIGTATPSWLLDIQGTANLLRLKNATAAQVTQAAFEGDAVTSYIWQSGSAYASYGGANSLNVYVTGNHAFAVHTNDETRMFITGAGLVGFGTKLPTNLISLGGDAARSIWMERRTTASTGYALTVQAGGAKSGETDTAGGDLYLLPGTSTGSAESGVQIQGCVAGASATTDRSMSTMVHVLGNKVGLFGVTPVVRPTALTTALTTVTCSAPGTPDYAIQDPTAGGFGFVTLDEALSLIKCVANLQTRVGELETKLQSLGALT